MNRMRTAVLTAAVAASPVFLTGCQAKGLFSWSAPPPNPAAQQQPVGSDGAGAPEGVQSVKLTVRDIPGLGPVVGDPRGMTLYRFDRDSSSPPRSNCAGDCEQKWPPMLVEPATVYLEGANSVLGTVARADGKKQLTLNGWPLYRFAKDSAPGQVQGQGVGGTWFAVTPEGKKASGLEPTNSPSPRPLTLTVRDIPGLGPVVTGPDGKTLYRFDRDTANPSATNCSGDCVQQWPPLLLTSDNMDLRGGLNALLGTVTRPDGTKQVTLSGWPLYFYAKDSAPGQAQGQGVGGTWSAATADGKKAVGTPAAIPNGPTGGNS